LTISSLLGTNGESNAATSNVTPWGKAAYLLAQVDPTSAVPTSPSTRHAKPVDLFFAEKPTSTPRSEGDLNGVLISPAL
jgi:hypothetical protein